MSESKRNIPELRFPEFTDEWEEKKLGEIVEFKNGINKEKEFFGQGNPIVNFKDVFNNRGLNLKDIKGKVTVNDSEKHRYDVRKGDVFFTRTSEIIEEIGMPSVMMEDIEDCVYSGFVIRAREVADFKLKNVFKKYVFITSMFRKEMIRKSSMTTRALTSGTALKNMIFRHPISDKEQEKVGTFFSKIDRLIELEEKKYELLEKQKRGYMQKIFSQDLRFKDENGNNYPEWEILKIGDILKERLERSDNGEMLSVTINKGVVKFKDLGRTDNSSKDKSNYKKVYPNDIAYNSMRMWQGASGKSNYEGIVSPAYTVLMPKESINSDYISYYFKTHSLIYKFRINSQGLTSDTWNLKYKQIKDIKIKIGVIREQEKIARFLNVLGDSISKKEEKIETLKQFKQGLLQKMFV